MTLETITRELARLEEQFHGLNRWHWHKAKKSARLYRPLEHASETRLTVLAQQIARLRRFQSLIWARNRTPQAGRASPEPGAPSERGGCGHRRA